MDTRRLAFALALPLLACDPPGGQTPTADLKPPDEPPVTEVGKSVWTPAVQVLIAENKGGGFRPAPPPGSTCAPDAARYTLTTATRHLDWKRCVGSQMVPYMETSGQRTLTEAEYSALGPTLSKLVIVTGTPCGADKPVYALTVRTAAGVQEYGDSFYSCTIRDRPLIDTGALGETLTAFRKLTGG
jgi:hypothetical protein